MPSATAAGRLRSSPVAVRCALALPTAPQDPDGRSDLTVDAATGRERFRIPGVAPRVERYVRADGAVYQDIQVSPRDEAWAGGAPAALATPGRNSRSPAASVVALLPGGWGAGV